MNWLAITDDERKGLELTLKASNPRVSKTQIAKITAETLNLLGVTVVPTPEPVPETYRWYHWFLIGAVFFTLGVVAWHVVRGV